jgi:oligopeptide transport system permease protein
LWLPSLVFCLLMICFNLFGDGLRDALDPKMRK